MTLKKAAFTLAEVLITLGIIGVVAALTMPTLIQNHRKHVVETRLKKFYSAINQAIRLSEAENGSSGEWDYFEPDEVITDENGNTKENIYYASSTLNWYNKYLKKYINTDKVETLDSDKEGRILVYFTDGSLMSFGQSSVVFYPESKTYSQEFDEENQYTDRDRDACGKYYFTFALIKSNGNLQIVPYGMYDLRYTNITDEQLKSNPNIGCKEEVANERALCTLLIARNGWKIPKDYPIRF